MRIIAITGGSGSGKSTLAQTLRTKLNCPIITEDDYYLDNAKSPGFVASQFNFDHLDARDHTLLETHLAALRSGQTVNKPHYCFKTHSRLNQESPLAPDNFLILEGIHLLCNPAVRGHFDLSVYLDLPDDIRFARRLLRDISTRGRTPESVIHQYLNTVRPAHELFTGPSKTHADFVIQPDITNADTDAQQRQQMEVIANQIIDHCKGQGWWATTNEPAHDAPSQAL